MLHATLLIKSHAAPKSLINSQRHLTDQFVISNHKRNYQIRSLTDKSKREGKKFHYSPLNVINTNKKVLERIWLLRCHKLLKRFSVLALLNKIHIRNKRSVATNACRHPLIKCTGTAKANNTANDTLRKEKKKCLYEKCFGNRVQK